MIPGPDASIASSNLQLASTAMSPVEDSRKHRQRTGPKRRVRECLTCALGTAEVDSGHCWRVLKHLDVTCGTFVEASSTVPKEGFGNVLTCALGTAEVDSGHCWRVLKHLDVTCGTFAEVSSEDCAPPASAWITRVRGIPSSLVSHDL